MVTGKTFGITNIIALDADRNVIQEQRVLVKRDEGKVVNLLRGTDRQSYNCTPQCNPSITIGDEQKYFDAIRSASQNKIEFSEGTGDKGAAGPIACWQGSASGRRRGSAARRFSRRSRHLKRSRRTSTSRHPQVYQNARRLSPIYASFSTRLAYQPSPEVVRRDGGTMVSKRADRRWRTPLLALLRRWRREESGATAIEFAIVAMPFVLLMFGLVSVCLFYFADFSMENATWQAARAVRTGQLQQSTGAYSGATTNADRQKALKKAFCDKAFLFTDCNTKAVVIVQSNAGFGSITQPNCAPTASWSTRAPPPSTPAPRARSCSSPSAIPGISAASCRCSRWATCRAALS